MKSKKESPKNVYIQFTGNLNKAYSSMYPNLKQGVEVAIHGWVEVWHTVIKDITRKGADLQFMKTLAMATNGREYDSQTMISEEYLIKSILNHARFNEIDTDFFKSELAKFSNIEKLIMADWCYQYNRMPEQKTRLESFFIGVKDVTKT